MRSSVPTQAQLLAQNRQKTRVAHKKRYKNVLGIAFGAAGLAAALGGMDWTVSVMLWGLSAASWAFLKSI
ncbi:MAG: hypothetical protein ABUS57_10175 [Pseudomonadota bacterium]